jgi:glutathione synthase/RimK-type ligase-like ATP-grasp enzyme
MNVVLQNSLTLLILLIALPLNLGIVLFSLIISRVIAPWRQPPTLTNPKRILITGGKMTKALQLCRSFQQAGHKVVLVETSKYWLSGHQFSQAVSKFLTVPAPDKDTEGYYQNLLKIVENEKIDVFIPVSSPVASYYDAVVGTLLSAHCEVIHFSPTITQMLDDKFTFCQKAQSLGLSAPKSFLITNPQQVLDFDFNTDGSQYILKSIRYDSVSRLEKKLLPYPEMGDYLHNLPISTENPWIMQEFIRGQEYCTHSTVRQGKIRLHCCSPSSPFQVNYEHVEKPEIFGWVNKFVQELNLTGQISFDFIETPQGKVYPIECNPRTHSAITMFYNHPGVAEAYLKDGGDNEVIVPLPNSKPTYWLYHELWRLSEVKSWSDLRKRLTIIRQGTDALFQFNDPLPFLTVPHWQITLLLLDNLRKLKGWIRIDFNIGKLVESGGD